MQPDEEGDKQRNSVSIKYYGKESKKKWNIPRFGVRLLLELSDKMYGQARNAAVLRHLGVVKGQQKRATAEGCPFS